MQVPYCLPSTTVSHVNKEPPRMFHLVYLKRHEPANQEPLAFRLHEYDVTKGGRLSRESTLAELQLGTLKVQPPGTNIFVPVSWDKTTELSIDRFPANTKRKALLVTGAAGPPPEQGHAQDEDIASTLKKLTLELTSEREASAARWRRTEEWMSDNSSATVDANDVTEEQIIDIDKAMGALVYDEGDKTLESDGQLEYIYAWLAGQKEDSQKQKGHVMAFINKHLLDRLPGAFAVVDINQSQPQNFPKASFSTHHRSFRGRAGYLIVPASRSYLTAPSEQRRYALVVIEIKKDLLKNAQALRNAIAQARLSHYTYATASNAAIAEVLTDLMCGGVVIYAQRIDGILNVFVRRIKGMKALWDYLYTLLAAVGGDPFPTGTERCRTENKALTLTEPLRHHFMIHGYQQPRLQAKDLIERAWDKIAEAEEAEDQEFGVWYPEEEECSRACAAGQPKHEWQPQVIDQVSTTGGASRGDMGLSLAGG